MNFYDLEFSDGKRCRMIDPDGDGLEPTNFQPGHLIGMTRVIGEPPDRLPWKRQTATLWTLGRFALSRLPDGTFHCFWPGGEVTGGKEEISAAVRENWQEGA